MRRRAQTKGLTLPEAEAELRAEPVPNLLGRQADPLEIAYGILFLACDESSFVTGAVLMADGGAAA